MTAEELSQLLPPDSPHRLYYSLQIVEFLAHGTKLDQKLHVSCDLLDFIEFDLFANIKSLTQVMASLLSG